MNNPIVSIIVPTYGGGVKLLARALDSIKSQSLEEWEAIIVDDNGVGTANQKATELVVEPYLTDERFKYIVHEYNKNGSAARNTGFAISTGKYIAFFDDDDEYLPNFLSSQVACFERQDSDCGLIYCSYEQHVEGKQNKIVYAKRNGYLLFDTLVHSFEIPTSSWLVRREVCLELSGFDESFKRHQDWEFLNRLAARYKIHANAKVCYKRYIGYRNSPKTPQQFIEYRLHYLNKIKDVIGMLPANQQKQVIVYNRIDAIIPLAKNRQFLHFIKQYISIHAGFVGIMYLVKRGLKL